MTGPHNSGHILAIDQGGHATRALVFDDQGNIVGRSEVPVHTQRYPGDRVELDPEAIIDSVFECVQSALDGLDASLVVTAGLATQRSTVVCWDRRTGEPLSPVLSWQDRRAATWLEAFQADQPRIHAATGLVVSPHYGASKLAWCLENLPEVSRALESGNLAWGPLSSFILFRTLNERPHLADPANASRTLLWDLETRDWSGQMLDLFGLPSEPLPTCVPSRHSYGTLAIPGAESIPLELCTGDQSAALFAGGWPDPDTVYLNMGTGAFLQRASDSLPSPVPGLLRGVVFQDESATVYVTEGTVNGAGSALALRADELGLSPEQWKAQAPAWLDSDMDPPLYLNGVSGLGSPYWAPRYATESVGEGSADAQMLAVLESIVFLVQVNLESMTGRGGATSRLVVTGGLSKLDGLCQKVADLSGISVSRPELHEATASGTARLLGLKVPVDASSQSPVFVPQGNPALSRRYAHWRSLLESRL
ncbi:MAG: FGGY family carbohydrate kinase [Xanthomonadales bacterium]|nr:FGGY family carbohydrate kinase [Xanthomonadales bacterium]